MSNELRTSFIFDDKDSVKIDTVRNKLTATDAELNNLGKTAAFGKNIGQEAAKGSDALGSLGKGVDSLKTKVESFAPTPSISRHLENEEKLVKSATERIAVSIDNAKASINPLTRPDLFSNKLSQPVNQTKEFGKPDAALFESVQKSRLEIQKLNSERIDAGKFDGLTKAGVRLHDQLGKTQADILRINTALKQTNNKTVIDELNKDLVQAQNNYDKLYSRQQQYESRQNANGKQTAAGGKPSGRGASRGGGGRGRITDVQATLLELTDDFAPEGFNRPFNAAARGMFALNAVSVTTLATFGAIAAVGYGIVKITENIREEAERRLKVENSISAAVNNQILSQKEALQNLQKMREEAQKEREFNRYLGDSSVEDLTRRRVNIERLQKLVPATLPTLEDGKVVSKPNENFLKNAEQLKTIDAQIDALRQRNRKTADDAFNQREENRKKSQEDAIRAQEKFNKSVEDGKKKALELGKAYNSVFDNLFSKTNSNNLFVQVFSEGEKALKSLRENLKGLDADLQSKAIAMQQKLNSNAQFETRIDNNLSVFDLRERARNLHNPYDAEGERKKIDEIARRSAETGGFIPNFGGSYGSFLANQAGGFDKLTDEQKRKIYETRSFGNLGFVGNAANSTFNSLNSDSLLAALANDRARSGGSENLSINDRLKKQLDIINSGVSNETERDIADRKLIGLTNGLNPSEINSNLREQIAAANEREAARRDGYERESLSIEKEKLAVQQQIAENGKRLLAIAEKEGLQGLNKAIEVLITNKSGGAADVKETGKSADGGDTRSYYEQFENR